ncbi:hypothetical protein SATMO3_22860 [Sporomusa aerivorans]
MMLEILQFIFQDFWHWLGSMLLVGAVSGGICRIFIGIFSK